MSSIQSTSSSGDAWAAMRAQRSQMHARMFAKVDTDGSGGVDKTELQTMLSDISDKSGTDLTSNIDDTFTKFDTNGDGTLSSDELGQGMHDLMPPPSTMDFAQARGGNSGMQDDLFSRIDTNGDGSIDKDEMTVVTDKFKSDTGKDGSDMFTQLDSDGDSKLTQAEFDAGRPEKSGSPQGAGGPPPGGGPGKTRGGGGAQSASGDSTTYDPLDTNKDGVVSELERLVGELKTATAAVSGDGHDNSQASLTIAVLAKSLYAQFAGSASQQSTNSVSAVA